MKNNFIAVIRNTLIYVLYKKPGILWANRNILKSRINAINIIRVEKDFLLYQNFHEVGKK